MCYLIVASSSAMLWKLLTNLINDSALSVVHRLMLYYHCFHLHFMKVLSFAFASLSHLFHPQNGYSGMFLNVEGLSVRKWFHLYYWVHQHSKLDARVFQWLEMLIMYLQVPSLHHSMTAFLTVPKQILHIHVDALSAETLALCALLVLVAVAVLANLYITEV